MRKRAGFFVLIVLLLSACGGRKDDKVYMGRLDAEKTIVSARASGELLELEIREGDLIVENQVLGQIDTETLRIQRKQQAVRVEELGNQRRTARYRIDQAEVQLNLSRDLLKKTENLLVSGGATEQKRDELAAQVEVAEAGLKILNGQLELLGFQEEEVRAGLELIDLSIGKASVVSPSDGIVLNRYHRKGELVSLGTPLLETADLSRLDLYIYLPLRDLPQVKIGQTVSVFLTGREKPLEGTVAWIASEGEFTPKTILTEETRDTLVYEVKVRVVNESGELKIGMPADVRF